MHLTDPAVVISDLSREVTLDGITVQVEIYRPVDQQGWMLAVFSEEGTCTFFDATFQTETAALGAFQFTVQDEGMATFADGGSAETLH